jgi:beta-lactam-binding protein with PASTA domain
VFAIPSVTGQTITDAVRTLTGSGFAVRQASTPSGSVGAGRIASQDPLPGVRVPHGSVVLIVASTGPPVPEPTPTPAGKRDKPRGRGHKGDD